MSSFLDDINITDKQVNSPTFGILYSKPGVGKSWLARFSDKPFYIATEKGCEKVPDIGRFIGKNNQIKIPATSDELFDALRYFVTTQHDYKTIVLDSGKFADVLFAADMIKKNPTETVKGQTVKVESISDIMFGRGYDKVMRYWDKFFVAVDALAKKGISVILIAHSHTKTAQDLNANDFKKEMIDLLQFGNYSVPNLVYARSDWCYYMRSEVKTRNVKGGFGSKTVAMEGGTPDVVVYTRSQNGFDAKCRTSDIKNIPDNYVLDFEDDKTSQIIFDDLKK